jgi:hypothetical protein
MIYCAARLAARDKVAREAMHKTHSMRQCVRGHHRAHRVRLHVPLDAPRSSSVAARTAPPQPPAAAAAPVV